MNRFLVSLFVFSVAVFAVAGGTWANDLTVELSREEIARAGVRTGVIASVEATADVRVVGELVRSPSATNEVRSLVHGSVEELRIAPGDKVVRGQTLIVIHSHEVHELSAQLKLSIQEERLARNRLEAGRRLLEIEGISRLDFERREHEVFRAVLAVEAAVVELEDMGLNASEIDQLKSVGMHSIEHGDLPIRAAVSGVVVELHVAPEARVQPWIPLLTLAKEESLEVALQVSPAQAQNIEPGDLIRFAPVGRPLCCSARVLTRVPQVDPTTRTVKIRARVDESRPSLFAGQFVEGVVAGRAVEVGAAVAGVPEGAVVRVGGEDIVFVDLGSGRFAARPVELGVFRAGLYEVTAGVEIGTQVAISGTFLLKSKMLRSGDGGDEEGAP